MLEPTRRLPLRHLSALALYVVLEHTVRLEALYVRRVLQGLGRPRLGVPTVTCAFHVLPALGRQLSLQQPRPLV